MRIIIIVCCLFMVGCASTSNVVYDPNDAIIDAECALKNSVLNIHDEVS